MFVFLSYAGEINKEIRPQLFSEGFGPGMKVDATKMEYFIRNFDRAKNELSINHDSGGNHYLKLNVIQTENANKEQWADWITRALYAAGILTQDKAVVSEINHAEKGYVTLKFSIKPSFEESPAVIPTKKLDNFLGLPLNKGKVEYNIPSDSYTFDYSKYLTPKKGWEAYMNEKLEKMDLKINTITYDETKKSMTFTVMKSQDTEVAARGG